MPGAHCGPVEAVLHVASLRGGSQPHLLRGSDEHLYVVKFRNNPQHPRVLANEMFVAQLGARLGLPMPRGKAIFVSRMLIEKTPELRIQLRNGSVPCLAGLHFASSYIGDRAGVRFFDYFPDSALERVRNLGSFAAILVLDTWTCNCDQRQAILWRASEDACYDAAFIDNGHCFNCGEWNFPDRPGRGAYTRNVAYREVRGWGAFEPWLTWVGTMDMATLRECAQHIPQSWYGRRSDMDRLLEELFRRRSQVRDLIAAFRDSSSRPFPGWNVRSLRGVRDLLPEN